jgi:WD repeat-containing protein 19
VAASGSDPQLQHSCLAGVTRTTLQLGDLRAGRQLALQANSSGLWKECGLILEQMQQLPEAAEMYERAGMVEKAASIHIASKNFAAAQPLMAQVKSAKLQLQYAKAKESEGRWADAAAAYEAAGAYCCTAVAVLLLGVCKTALDKSCPCRVCAGRLNTLKLL